MSKTPNQWCDLAAELIHKGDKQEALYDFDEAINIDPYFGRAYYEKAIALGSLGRETEAVELFKKSIPLGFDNAATYFNMGKYLYSLGRFEEALESYITMLKKDPKNIEAFKNKGNCLIMLERVKEAIESFAKAIELNPTDYDAYSCIGPLLEDIGKKKEAKKYYDTCLSKDFGNFGCNYLKGCLLWKERKYQESIHYLEIAFNVNNFHLGSCYHIGNAYISLGNNDKGMEFFGKANQMKPEFAIEYCHRGQCNYLLGRKNEALQDFINSQDLLDDDIKSTLPLNSVNTVKKTLKNVQLAERTAIQVETALKLGDPAKKGEFKNLKKLQEELNKIQNKMVTNLHHKEGLEGVNEFSEIRKKLAQIQTSLGIQIVEIAPDMTADQWCKYGESLKKQNRTQEAIKAYNEAIAIDPKWSRAYFDKALALSNLERHSDAVECYKKAILAGYQNQINAYYDMGISLSKIGRREEAVEANTIALMKDPLKADAYRNRANSYMMLNKLPEAVESYAKAIQLKPETYNVYSDIGSLLEDLGRRDEALRYYDTCLYKSPQNFRANYSKGCLLFREGKYLEAIRYLEAALQALANHPGVCYFLGNCHIALGNRDKAMTYFNQADNMKPSLSIQYCNRGQCYFAIGQKEKGLADFKKARELLESDRTTMLAPKYINFMKSALRTVLESENIAKQTEEQVKTLDKQNPIVQKFILNMKKLQDNQDHLQNKVVEGLGQVNTDEARIDVNELDKFKEEFKKQFEDMQREIGQLKSQVKTVETEVKNIKNEMEGLKEEIDNKMDDFNKKLDKELDKQDLSPEDQTKLKGYYSAFIGTFTSIYITSQVVDSGQVKLASGTHTGTILSFLASFAPFIGNNLSTAVSSLDEFLHSQEMIKNARRMKGIAHDTVTLSQLIGSAGYEIVIDKKKQQTIIKVTQNDLKQVSGSLFQQVQQICEHIKDKLDAYLYTELYKTPAERVGHNDANELIKKWIKGEIVPYDIDEQFVAEILKDKTIEPQNWSPSAPMNVESVNQRSACCNLF